MPPFKFLVFNFSVLVYKKINFSMSMLYSANPLSHPLAPRTFSVAALGFSTHSSCLSLGMVCPPLTLRATHTVSLPSCCCWTGRGQDQVGSEDVGPTSPSLMGGVQPLPTKGVRAGDASCRLRTSPNRSNLLRTLFNREWVLILSMLFLHLVI